jgi:nucleotide-binding universal stress UspA family protein
MFTRILIGVDGRDGGRDALTLGARLARVCDAGITAVHVARDTARAVLHGAHWRSPSLAAVSAPSPGTDGRSGWASTVPPRRGGP